MSHATQVAIDRALALLNAVKARYKIICEDGTEHGDLEVVQPKAKRKKGPYEYGALRTYFTPLIKDMKVGDCRQVPFDRFDATRLRGAVSGWAVHHWGNGSNITTVDRTNGVVEILRVS